LLANLVATSYNIIIKAHVSLSSPYQFTSDLGASDEAFCTTSMRHIISQAAEGYNPQEMYQLMAEQRVSIVFDVS